MNSLKMVQTEHYMAYIREYDGAFHCEDGPARIWRDRIADGSFVYDWRWMLNGVEHRADGGPSWAVGYCVQWFKHGRLHNLNGPAYISSVSDMIISRYMIDGICISQREFSERYLVTHFKEYEPEDPRVLFHYWRELDCSSYFISPTM